MIFITFSVYIGLLFFYQLQFGKVIFVLSLIPVLVSGLAFGFWGGNLSSLFLTLVHSLFLYFFVTPGSIFISQLGIFGHLSLFIIGTITGHLSTLQQQVNLQNNDLEQQEKAKLALTDSLQDVQAGLHETEARLKQFFEHFPDPLFIEDLDGNILDVNRAACKLHNMSRDRLIGKNAVILI